MTRATVFSVIILLLAAALRLNAAAYGLSDVCLTVPAEHWLFSEHQTVSLYNWNIAPRGALDTLAGRVSPAPLVTAETSVPERLFVRLAGVAAGLLTVAVVLRLGRGLRARWWWLAGLLVAAAPWLVAADRWITPFDAAPLVVSISLFALWLNARFRSRRWQQVAKGIHTAAALSLLLIAPPLWWLAILLLLIQPNVNWRLMVFLLLAGIILIPALQTPELWIAAAQQWDAGTTAACALVVLLLALWWRRDLSRLSIGVLTGAAVVMGGVTLAQDAQLKQPSADEWQLVRWLQQRIPDETVIAFDYATWQLAPIVACPMGADIRFQPQSFAVEFFDARELAQPYYTVSVDADAVAAMPYAAQINDQFWVGRTLDVPHATDVAFGDLVHVLGYDLVTTATMPAGLVDLRIDYQFGANITPDVLAYAAFVHVTPKDDPLTNWANITDPFFAESGNTGSRRVMLNHHIRFSLPPTMPPGLYDVRLGIFNVYTGESVGEAIMLGELRVNPVD